MVVGTNQYIDKKEAFPLDKKTLRKIAFRSFFTESATNSETGSSLGYTWAMEPGLKKIHENQEDLSVSLGHNLEYVPGISLFSSLLMGVVLSMEAQKADTASIRSVKSALSLSLASLEKTVLYFVFYPALLFAVATMIQNGNPAGIVIFALISFVINVVLRFTLINVGYKQGSNLVEKLGNKKDMFTNACVIAGVFMIGAFLATLSLQLPTLTSSSYATLTLIDNYLPGVVYLIGTLCCYHLLTKKNWSLIQCAVVLILLGFVLALL